LVDSVGVIALVGAWIDLAVLDITVLVGRESVPVSVHVPFEFRDLFASDLSQAVPTADREGEKQRRDQ
jgi:hypothetical protein